MAQNNTHQVLQDVVNNLANELGLVLRLGYIGNLERWGDDRSWRVWIEGIRNRRTNNVLSVGGHATDVLDLLLEAVENGAVQARIREAFFRQDLWRFANVHHWDRTVIMSAFEVEEVVNNLVEAL
jgi:hypothetical protein